VLSLSITAHQAARSTGGTAMTRTSLWALLLASTVACSPPAAPPKMALAPTPNSRVVYELREKCGKDSSDWFRREHGEVTDGLSVKIKNNYSNHYSVSLNRCYAVASDTTVLSAVKGVSTIVDRAIVVDVNENREIGLYFQNSKGFLKCAVDNSPCSSLDEWKHLANSYMSD
jgi:hypothetical protein